MAHSPLPEKLLAEIDQLSPEALSWLAGYAYARAGQGAAGTPASAPAPRGITILSASQTGNARGVAEELEKTLAANGIPATLIAAGNYKSKTIAEENILLLVCSTQGEGDPPEEAIPLFKFLTGKKAPDLTGLNYAVLALGDSTYPDFCQAGRLFDKTMAGLNAKPLLPRVDCDVEYDAPAKKWMDAVTKILAALPQAAVPAEQSKKTIPTTEPVNLYTKDNPYTATLSLRQKITARGANKDIEHLEIDIDDALYYLPGDSLGVWPTNDPELVEEILAACHFTGDERITLENGEEVTIRESLLKYDEITQNYPKFVKGLAAFSLDEELLHIANNPPVLQQLIENESILSLLKKYPAEFFPKNLHNFLRRLIPRFYSIASAQSENPHEVHLTVGVVRFNNKEGKTFTGGASGFLGERLKEGESLRVFIEPNTHFRLPRDPATPIIMIAAGTGIAPFRAFMQEREHQSASGKNWLIFGNQNFTLDFLYQLEWQEWHKEGLLNEVSLAFSRDDPKQKVYVQHKILENAELFWQWLEEGAAIYVCGDANHMAKDVEKAILTVIGENGKMTADAAEEYLNELRENNRYERDVY